MNRATKELPPLRPCRRRGWLGSPPAVVFVAMLLATASSACSTKGDSTRTLPWPEDSLYSLVVRADFTHDAAWQRIRSEIEAPVGEFRAGVRFVDDPRFDQITVGELLELAKEDSGHFIAFLVDRETLAGPEHPILAVDLTEQPGRTVRVLPKAMWDIQANIALANTDWESYLEVADEKGIYRGFL